MKKHHVNFRFATEILRRLGEELNPSADQGIMELVKNAYDADALSCTVRFDKAAGGTIKIDDDGDGMELDVIKDAWLLIGRSAKVAREKTRLGRTPVGNKGLGRLAALRLGRTVELRTRPITSPTIEYFIRVDWSLFDSATTVEEVDLTVERRRRKRSDGKGTTIVLSGIRNQIAQVDLRRLARRMVLLADPFGDNPLGFQPTLKASAFRELEKLVQQRYFRDAEYYLKAEVDAGGFAAASVTDFRGRVLFKATHNDLRGPRNRSPYQCPAATFDLWNFLLSGKHFSTRQSTVAEVKEWLDAFGGVHLYINDIRVSPYGDPGNDWLDMNRLRTASPEERPSTNNSIGRISVYDEDDLLLQKTDRSGIFEDAPFNDLRQFAVDAIIWMSKRRVQERDRRIRAEKEATQNQATIAKNALFEWLSELPPKDQSQAEKAFVRYERLRDREADLLQRETQLYRLLGTTGISAAVFRHEAKNAVVLIARNARIIGRRLSKYFRKEPDDLKGCLEIILNQVTALNAYDSLTLNFVNRDKRRMGRVNLHATITRTVALFEPLLKESGITITMNLDTGTPYLRASEAAIESVMANLLLNSIRAFTRVSPRDRMIDVRTIESEDTLTIHLNDNAGGFIDIEPKDIWLPGETTYEDGTGLGLTIVRDTVQELGGRVRAAGQEELGGAHFAITLPIIRS